MDADAEALLRQILTAIDALTRRVEALERQDTPQGNVTEHLLRAIQGTRFRPPERRVDPELSAKRSAAAKSMWDKVKSKLSTEIPTEVSTPTRRRVASKLQAKPSVEESKTSMQSASNLQASASKDSSKTSAPDEPETTPPALAGAKLWLGYSTAYKLRYGVFPVRNAKVNALLKQFVSRVPMAEAPSIAEFYIKDDEPLYVKSAHCVELMLRDAEKLRMAWATGRRLNGNGAGKPWWEAWSGIEAMGKELGIASDENPQVFRQRVLHAAHAAGRLPQAESERLGFA